MTIEVAPTPDDATAHPDAAEARRTPERAGPPIARKRFPPRPSPEPADIDAAHDRIAARYPRILARLAE